VTANGGMVVTDTLTSSKCAECGVVFGLPWQMHENRRVDSKTFYCPNGHGQSYRVSEVDKLKKELLAEKQRREAAELGKAGEAKRAERAEVALARHVKRTRSGVCPHCQRSFSSLRRHIETKHPDAAGAAS
jgi:hypothetical protein